MAETRFYPQLPSRAWWTIHDRFLKSLPSTVTDSYLASILDVKPAAAKAYIRDLRVLGLVDDENKPTDLAKKWRDEKQYEKACREILGLAYPPELLNIAPPPDPDRAEVERWFLHTAGLGSGSAKNRAAMYTLIARGGTLTRKAKVASLRRHEPHAQPEWPGKNLNGAEEPTSKTPNTIIEAESKEAGALKYQRIYN